MADFSSVVKLLQLTPASRDTEVVTKPLSLTRSRQIGMLFKAFTCPALTGTNYRGRMLAQVNYTAPASFRIRKIIPNMEWSDLQQACFMTIRYRIDGTVYRYKIPFLTSVTQTQVLHAASGLQADWYNNEIIKPEFSLEVWGLVDYVEFNAGDFTLLTSMLEVPTDPSQQDYVESFEYTDNLSRADLVSALPETLPTNYGTESAWNSN